MGVGVDVDVDADERAGCDPDAGAGPIGPELELVRGRRALGSGDGAPDGGPPLAGGVPARPDGPAGHGEPRGLGEPWSRPGSGNRSGAGPDLPKHYLAAAVSGDRSGESGRSRPVIDGQIGYAAQRAGEAYRRIVGR